jgi:uncharacterized repeat protein (TIGR03803 family)
VVVQLGGAKSIRTDERKSGDVEAALREHHYLLTPPDYERSQRINQRQDSMGEVHRPRIPEHEFRGKNGDGAGPQAGPIRDADGNLYGTTLYGGGSRVCADGCGTVWQLSPPALASGTGNWTEHILHRFGFSHNEAFPGVGQLALDPQGNLYGAVQGGKYRAGIIYRLSRVQGGSGMDEAWRETVLYNFTGGADGGFPEGVILDKAGNLYGICGVGGSYGYGTVFKLSPHPPSNWEYTLLHTFNGYDGAEPVANLTFGSNGKVYGTTATGGTYGGGVVFEITP